MDEFASPSLGTYDERLSIPGMLAERLARDPDGVFLERQTGIGGTWVPMTVKGFVAEPRALDGAEDITRLGGWRAYMA